MKPASLDHHSSWVRLAGEPCQLASLGYPLGLMAPEAGQRLTLVQSPSLDSTGSVLFVCDGNVTRSPFMQLAFQALCDDGGIDGIDVRSAGLQALPGHRPDDHVLAWLDRRSIPHADFTSRLLTDQHITDADLIITASRRQRDLVVRRNPRSSTRTFTLRQLDRLVGGDSVSLTRLDPDCSAPAAVADVAHHRRGLTASAGAADDISDPTGRRDSAYRATFALVYPALERLALAMRAVDHPSSSQEKNCHA